MWSYLPPLIGPPRDVRVQFAVFAAQERWQRRRGARVPWDVYRGDRRWTPPLRGQWITERGDTEELGGPSSRHGRERLADPKLAEMRFDLKRRPRRARAGLAVTQMHYARRGIVTPEMEFIAIRENQRIEAITEAVRFDAATPNQTAIPSDSFWFTDYDPYSYDPERAQELLDEAGVSDLTVADEVAALRTAVETLVKGSEAASEIGEAFLKGRALAIWRDPWTDGDALARAANRHKNACTRHADDCAPARADQERGRIYLCRTRRGWNVRHNFGARRFCPGHFVLPTAQRGRGI